MAEWIEVPAHRIYAISERELRDDFDYIGENGRPVARGEIPYRFVRRRTAKFLSGPASLRNIPKFITARRSKRYDFMEWATNGHTDGFSRDRPPPMKYSRTILSKPLQGGSRAHK